MSLFRTFQRLGIFLFTLIIVTTGMPAAAEDIAPDATLQMKETEVGLLLGGDWGKGKVSFQGAEHAFKMAGAKVGGIGITSSEVSGKVYGLSKIDDFYGTYFKAEAGITGVEGREGSWVKNAAGVSLHLKSESKGLALSIGVEGLKISR